MKVHLRLGGTGQELFDGEVELDAVPREGETVRFNGVSCEVRSVELIMDSPAMGKIESIYYVVAR